MSRVIIIGGMAAGASVAARLRRLRENDEIIILEKTGYISYASCGLPYHIGDVIPEFSTLVQNSPEKLSKLLNIEVNVHQDVVSIERTKKEIQVKDLTRNHTYKLNYDYLVIATGTRVKKLPIEGMNDEDIYYLKDMEDTKRLKEYLSSRKIKSVLMLGAGFIGLEIVENLRHIGIEVSLVEMLPQVYPPFDFEMTNPLVYELIENDVTLYLGDKIASVKKLENSYEFSLDSGKKINAEMLISSVGIVPNSEIAAQCGLQISSRGGVIVSGFMQTNDPFIFAAGDVTDSYDYILKQNFIHPFASPTSKQARIVADRIAGIKSNYFGSMSSYILKLFEFTAGGVGYNEKILLREKIPYRVLYNHQNDHASYYKSPSQIHMKILYSPADKKILGFQAIGKNGVDKRIDAVATLITSGGCITDLSDIEFSYAPPYNSVRDPLNNLGTMAQNVEEGRVSFVTVSEYLNNSSQYHLYDIRESIEYETFHIENACSLPWNEINNKYKELPSDKPLVLYCNTAKRSYFAACALSQKGFKVFVLNGGFYTYKHHIENPDLISSKIKELGQISLKNIEQVKEDSFIDAKGLPCPGPILKLKEGIIPMLDGQILKVQATDNAFTHDVSKWCNHTGNTLLGILKEPEHFNVYIQKGKKNEDKIMSVKPSPTSHNINTKKIFLIGTDELEKATTAFMIASTAASSGDEVTLFFIFKGINLIRNVKSDTEKDPNKFGNKGYMIRWNEDNPCKNRECTILSIEEYINILKECDAKFICCQMALETMGLNEKDLIDGVKMGGIMTYIEEADKCGYSMQVL